MMDRILDFFRRMFSGGEEEPLNEDASSLGMDNLEQAPDDTSNPNSIGSRDIMGTRSRSLDPSDVGEVIDVTDGGNEEIVITAPRYLWLLDNGHGKDQKGKRSPLFPDGSQLLEWEFNRDIVKRMQPALDRAGVQYHVVVPEENVGSFLRERVQRANRQTSPLGLSKIFVSIHANALGMGNWDNRAKGLEVWHYPNSTSGTRLASAFQRELLKHLPEWDDRGIKAHTKSSGKIFYVLANTNMPAVLTENGFYTHEEEAAELMKPEIRQKIADAHVAAILDIEQNGWENISPYDKSMLIG